MSEQNYSGYKGYIVRNNGEILYDAGRFCIAHFSYPEDTRYYVRCEFPVKVGLHDTSCPELWTSDENEARELIGDPEKTIAWIRERINSDPDFSRYVGQPIIEKEHKLPNYGGDPQLMAKTPQYIIFRCHWPASEEYWLASESLSRSPFDSAPLWSYTLSREQAEFFLANPEKIGPFYIKMTEKYPLGH